MRDPVHVPHALRWGKFVMLGLVILGAGALCMAGAGAVNGFCATVCPAGSLYGLIPYYGTTAVGPISDVFLRFDVHSGAHWIVVGHLLFFAVFLFFTFKYAARLFGRGLCPLGGARRAPARRGGGTGRCGTDTTRP